MYKKEIQRLEANIIDLQDFAKIYNQSSVYEKTLQLVGDEFGNDFQGILSPFINSIDSGMNRLKLTFFQDRFSNTLKSKLLQMSNSEPMTIFSIPLDVNNRFQSLKRNKLRINIYPSENTLNNSENLNLFLTEASLINENFIGYPKIFQSMINGISSFGMKNIFLLHEFSYTNFFQIHF